MARLLGYDKVNVAGHDIGSMVAFSFAANHPEATLKIALLDVPRPDEMIMEFRMLPEVGKFGDKIDDEHPGYPWWFAFHQVKGLPEQVLQGRFPIYQNFLIDYLIKDPKSISQRDRAIYAAAYSTPDAIRCGDAWYHRRHRHFYQGVTIMNHAAAVISLSKWLDQVGVTPCTAWRWRKKGWLKTVNIAGRQYLTQESIDEFHHRASAGEFAQVHKVPATKGT